MKSILIKRKRISLISNIVLIISLFLPLVSVLSEQANAFEVTRQEGAIAKFSLSIALLNVAIVLFSNKRFLKIIGSVISTFVFLVVLIILLEVFIDGQENLKYGFYLLSIANFGVLIGGFMNLKKDN